MNALSGLTATLSILYWTFETKLTLATTSAAFPSEMSFPVTSYETKTVLGFPVFTICGMSNCVNPYFVVVFGGRLNSDATLGFMIVPPTRKITPTSVKSRNRTNTNGLRRLTVDSYVSFALKYSPSSALVISGVDSS
jgi:hypothetical protein